MPPDYVTQEQLYAVTGKIADFASRVEGLADLLANVPRAPSKAALIGGAPMPRNTTDGTFLRAVMQARSRSAEEQAQGKATLDGLGVRYVDEAELSGKAALGTSDATGGWVMPNAIVEDLLKPALFRNPYRRLITVVDNVRSASVDIPFRSAAPARATIASWGTLKENVDLAYNGYSATMYTLARIHDLSAGFVRYSAGAAEQDVMTELGHALALGEAWYTINGTGTGMPYGLRTALTNAPATFTSSFSPAATLPGSIAAAIATAAGALLERNRRPEAAVIAASAYATMLTQGATEGGFYLSGISGPQSLPGFAPGTVVSPFGIPVIPDPGFAGDDLIVGEWSALKMYVGAGPRIDSSDQAGTRWDYNVIGFRGEEDIALDARPAVYAGAFQLVEDIIP